MKKLLILTFLTFITLFGCSNEKVDDTKVDDPSEEAAATLLKYYEYLEVRDWESAYSLTVNLPLSLERWIELQDGLTIPERSIEVLSSKDGLEGNTYIVQLSVDSLVNGQDVKIVYEFTVIGNGNNTPKYLIDVSKTKTISYTII